MWAVRKVKNAAQPQPYQKETAIDSVPFAAFRVDFAEGHENAELHQALAGLVALWIV